MRSGNPVLKSDVFVGQRSYDASGVMTTQGVVNKTFILLFLAVFRATWTWANPQKFLPFIGIAAIGGFLIGLVTVFKKEWVTVTAPVYALLEGFILGGISSIFEKQFPGIVIQAVGLTFGVLFSLLFAYSARMIKVTNNFRTGVIIATGGIVFLYFISFLMGLFGVRIPFIHESGTLGIGFSIFVVIIASLNLILDFDFIEQGSQSGAPKYMEWYGAFGLMVTLIWLYFEILRLLGKMRNNR